MGMTYGEIITASDELYPNGYTLESKLTQLYVNEKKLLRTIYRRKTSTVFDIQKDQFLYPLDFHYSKIIKVVWEGRTVEYEEINSDTESPPFLYTYQNAIGRYPTPEQDVVGGIIIFHYIEPILPTLETYELTYPSFDNDFPMVQVYDLCRHNAVRSREYDVANGFIIQMNAEIQEFKKANPEPDVPYVRVE